MATVQPLRQVATCERTGRIGKEIGPHQFWLATEYSIRLSCGHEVIAVKNVYSDMAEAQVREGLEVRRYRCPECPPRQLPENRPQTPHPGVDPLAVRIAQISMLVDEDATDEVLAWTRECLAWIEDPVSRSAAYGAVALTLLDHFRPSADLPQLTEAADHLRAWLDSGDQDGLVAAKKAARRAYAAQHRGGDWFAVRGALAASAIVPPRGRASADKLAEALEWNEPAKKARIDTALAARRQAEIYALLIGGALSESALQIIRSAVGTPIGVTAYSAPLLAQIRTSFAARRARDS
jgi:hypothetical protein